MEEDIGKIRSKRAGKKKKGLNEKQLLNMYFSNDPSPPAWANDTNGFENGQEKYLSNNERARLEKECKYTKPKNPRQELYCRMLRDKTKKIIVATGPAGTGKTLLGTEMGIKLFLSGAVEKLIFTRPSVSVDEDLGYLPGSLEDKIAPWIRPIYYILYQHILPRDVSELLESKTIEIAPLGFMRGRTFKNTWIVADEMQNSTKSQMKMLLTRLGENSRIVITGDLEQSDKLAIPDEKNGLEDFLDKFKGKRSSSISSLEFDREDIQREEVVKEILEIYAGDMIFSTDEDTNSSDGSVGSSAK